MTLNNQVLARFSDAERARIGVHTCPGGDQDSTHSADVDYAELLPDLFGIKRRSVFRADGERGPIAAGALDIIARERRSGQIVYVGVDRCHQSARRERRRRVCERVMEAAEHLGDGGARQHTDDCGFSPFGDDISTARETAFAKIPGPDRRHEACRSPSRLKPTAERAQKQRVVAYPRAVVRLLSGHAPDRAGQKWNRRSPIRYARFRRHRAVLQPEEITAAVDFPVVFPGAGKSVLSPRRSVPLSLDRGPLRT